MRYDFLVDSVLFCSLLMDVLLKVFLLIVVVISMKMVVVMMSDW